MCGEWYRDYRTNGDGTVAVSGLSPPCTTENRGHVNIVSMQMQEIPTLKGKNDQRTMEKESPE
jgi:hypothetical protein